MSKNCLSDLKIINYCSNAVVDSSGFWIIPLFIVISPSFLYNHKGLILLFSFNGSLSAKHCEL